MNAFDLTAALLCCGIFFISCNIRSVTAGNYRIIKKSVCFISAFFFYNLITKICGEFIFIIKL